jgi:hypothetical protein
LSATKTPILQKAQLSGLFPHFYRHCPAKAPLAQYIGLLLPVVGACLQSSLNQLTVDAPTTQISHDRTRSAASLSPAAHKNLCKPGIGLKAALGKLIQQRNDKVCLPTLFKELPGDFLP